MTPIIWCIIAMSATSLEIQPAVPGEFLADEIVSTSQSILRKELIPIFPENNSTFTETNSEIRIHVDDADSFLFSKESYLQFTLTHDKPGFLTFPDGGCGSLFRDIELRINKTSIQLDRWEYHNFENGVNAVLNDDPTIIENMGYASGDTNFMTPEYAHFQCLPALAVADFNAAAVFDGTQVGPGEHLAGLAVVCNLATTRDPETARVNIGDVFSNGEEEKQAVVVVGINRKLAATAAAAFLVKSIGSETAVGADYYRIGAQKLPPSGRFTFRLPLDAMNINWPLFLLPGGLNLILRLAPALQAFNSGKQYAATTSGGGAEVMTIVNPPTITYSISDVKFMAMLVTPHIDLKNKAIDDFNGRGLVYGFQGVRTKFIPFSTSQDQNFDVNWGIRSARKAISYITTDSLAFNSGAPRAYNSITMYPRAGVYQYQYKVGIHAFPRRELDCTNAREMHRQIYNCNKSKTWRISGSDLLGNGVLYDAAAGQYVDSKRFLMVADLSRYNGDFSEMTGIDLTIAHLQLELKETASFSTYYAGQLGNAYLVMHVVHDKYVRLHASNISVIQ